MNEIQNSLFEAMKAFTEASSAESKATVTVQAAISSVVDEGLGEYSVEYLGNTFSVYANSNATYSIGDIVYILIPNGDFSENKIILGLVNPKINTFVNESDEGTIYYEVSDNLIDRDFGVIEMSSYATTEVMDKPITTLLTNGAEINFNNIIKEYFDKYKTYSLSFLVKTSMLTEQQSGGNYGISLKIPVIENAVSGGGKKVETWKAITLDVGNMLGNPYRLTTWTPQKIYFTLDDQWEYDVKRIPTLSYFCYGFNQDSSKENIKDILIKDISFNAVNAITEEDTRGYKLTLKASQGIYFSPHLESEKTITPTLRVNGKVTSLKKAEIFWFIEDASVKPNHKDYLVYGGYGWRCLNEKTNIAISPEGEEIFDYVTSVDSLTINERNIGTSARYKCIVTYDKIRTEALITLKNLSSPDMIQLKSTNDSNVYVKDTGYVDLTITSYVKGVTEMEANRSSIAYSWVRYDKNGNYINDSDDFFQVALYNSPVRKKFGESIVDCFETRINFPVNRVDEVNTILCSVKNITIDDEGLAKEELIGTESILISTSADLEYNLELVNGNQLYKYDNNGNSPMEKSYIGPYTSKRESIPALGFIIRKADGKELTSEEYAYVEYTWKVPKNSLFTIDKENFKDEGDYYSLTKYASNNDNHSASLAYGIEKRYDIAKADKRISLVINFQGKILEREVPISFIREGMDGTNGTAYSAELVFGGTDPSSSSPYGTIDANGVANKLKFVYNSISKELYRHDNKNNVLIPWSDNENKLRIYPKVYYNGELLETEDFDIEYSMFDERITNPCLGIVSTKRDEFTNSPVLDTYKGVLLDIGINASTESEKGYCNILQAKITPKKNTPTAALEEKETTVLYCYYPIEFTVYNFVPDGGINFVPSVDGGFSEVMYAADGTNPKWDDSFDFVCNDTLLLDKEYANYFDISWEAKHHLSPSTGTGKTFTTRPDNKYNDGNSQNMIITKVLFKEDAADFLKVQRDYLCNYIDEKRKEKRIYRENKRSLEDFAQLYQGKRWKKGLESIKELLTLLNEAVTELNYTIDEGIKDFGRFMDMHPKSLNLTSIKAFYTDLLEIKDKRALPLLKKAIVVGGDEATKPTHIVRLDSFEDVFFEFPLAEFKNPIERLEIQTIILNLNTGIDKYRGFYKKLTGELDSNEKYILNAEQYLHIVEDIITMCGRLEQSDIFPCYTQLAKNCRAYAKKFDERTSLNKLKQAIDDMYNNILVGIFYLNDEGNLVLSAATEKEFENNFKRIEDEIKTAENQIAGYDTILKHQGKAIVHYRPIVLYYNRYEMSNINAWDGNKIDTGDGSYLLAPQIGAGVKEQDNSFTGMMMGIRDFYNKSDTDSAKQQVGLFGYYKGQQSLKLDAKNGSAIFGLGGEKSGQIIIDPSPKEESGKEMPSRAMLYSNNFFKEYNNYTRLPKHYSTSNYAHEGMMIDLSTPEIRFGNGNFVVTAEGNTTIAGSDNTIGGWKVTDTQIHSNLKPSEGRITIDSGRTVEETLTEAGDKVYVDSENGAKIYTYSHDTLDTTKKGFYLGKDGFSMSGEYEEQTEDGESVTRRSNIKLDVGGNPVIHTGSHSALDSKQKGFYLSDDGLSIGSTLKVDVAKSHMKIGRLSSSKYWTIDGDTTDSKIYYGTQGKAGSVYLTTKDFSMGSRFYIDAESGSLRLGAGAVDTGLGKEDASERHWIVSSDSLNSYIGYNASTFGSTTANSIITIDNNNDAVKSNSVYLGTDGIRLGKKFAVDNLGNVKAHYITATGGTIANWEISGNYLIGQKNDNKRIVLNSAGSIAQQSYNTKEERWEDDGWKIGRNGSATFNNITANNTGNIGGWTIGSGKLTSQSDSSGNKITLNANGSISSTNWDISRNGIARFKNIIITSGANKPLTGTGSSINFGNFSVDTSGSMSASGASVSGTIKASAGEFGSAVGKKITIANDGSASIPEACIDELTTSKLIIAGRSGDERKVTIAQAHYGYTIGVSGTTDNVVKSVDFLNNTTTTTKVITSVTVKLTRAKIDVLSTAKTYDTPMVESTLK